MFKPARWWSEKNKVKVVFKLQFHASQVPHGVGDALMISIIPADGGKPTLKSEKATIQDGSCFWENPLYETVKFNQDPKSGKIHEKIYHFVVGTGSSKAGIVGEASIDFSNYAEATKVSSLSLPLKNSRTEVVLHVSIQRVQESKDQREVEQNDSVKVYSKDESLTSELSIHDIDGANIKSNTVEDAPFEISSSGSESSSGVETQWELQFKNSNNNNIHEEEKSGAPTPKYDEHKRSWEWLGNSGREISTEDASSTLTETSEIEKLKSEVVVLSRRAEMSELELQTLRKQIMKESKRGQDLWNETVCLKEERDALKEECGQLKLKSFRTRLDVTKSKTNIIFDGVDSQTIIEELRQELNHSNELNNNLRIQLQKTQESNSELVLAVRDLDEMLKQKNRETLNPSTEVGPTCRPDDQEEEDDDDEEQKALEELVKEHSDSKEAYLLEQQIMDLRGEIEIYKRDKDELEMQMEQLALDYEILKQENHEISCKLEQSEIRDQLKMQDECSLSSSSDSISNELEIQIENLENDLKKQSENYSCSLVTISELEARAKSLEEELEKQAQGFEADLEAITRSKIDEEQRAIRAEEMLKKTRWKNANTAERLQEEFRRLSVQMASSFEANEELAKKALDEANELRLQKCYLEQELDSVNASYEARLSQLGEEIEKMEIQKKNAEDEIEMLSAKNKILLEDMGTKESLMCEMERMRMWVKEMELLVDQANDDKIERENKVELLKNEAEGTRKELNKMRCILEEKELIVGNLQSEIGVLEAKCTELKRSVSEEEVEKEKLRKQMAQLRNDTKKKEDAFNSMEKKMKSLDVVKGSSKNSKPLPRGSKEVAFLKERIKLLEGEIKLKEDALETSANTYLEKEKDLHHRIQELEGRLEVPSKNNHFCLNEAKKDNEFKEQMVSLKERNESMEGELKEMQERYSEISLKFAEVEGERQQLIMRLRSLKNAVKG